MTIAELAEDRVVEGVYAVRMKRKLRTKSGASYLALELVDPTGRIEARVWNDVELLDGRFAEGDAVRVLGRVEKFRDRLQLDVRSLEAADVDPATLTPALRRDARRARGFLEFLVAELTHPGLARDRATRCSPTATSPRSRRRPTTTTPTRAACSSTRSASRRSRARRRSSTRGCAATCCSRRRSCTTSAARSSSGRGPAFALTDEGRLLGHVHLGLRLIEERAEGLTAAQLRGAPALRRGRTTTRARARTAEAAVLYHANQLDAVAATRKVD